MCLTVLSWFAVIILSVSYWFQIWKIHVHKEVRDLSLTYNVLLAVGFGVLAFTAVQQGSFIFLVKQIMTTIPVVIIIGQIIYHKNAQWHDDSRKRCTSCENHVEQYWNYCAHCSAER